MQIRRNYKKIITSKKVKIISGYYYPTFRIELTAAVGVFILCAAVCVGVIVQAEVMSRDSADLVRAVNEARNAAECFKAADGDLERTAALFGGKLQSVGAAVSVVQTYDENWNRFYSPQADQTPSAATTADGISYRLCLTPGVRRPVSEESGESDAPGDSVRRGIVTCLY